MAKTQDVPSLNINENTIVLPEPSELNLNQSVSQILSAQYTIDGKQKNYTSEIYIEINTKKLVMVAVAGWGGTLFSIDYDGKAIKSASLPMPNAHMGIKHTLFDFLLTYASEPVIKRMLFHSNINVDYTKKSRRFDMNGKRFIEITYQNENPWTGKVVLKNFLYNYTINIQTLNMSKNNS